MTSTTWLGKLGSFVSQVAAVAAVPIVLAAAVALRPGPGSENSDPAHPRPCRICDAGQKHLPRLQRRVRFDPDIDAQPVRPMRRAPATPVAVRTQH